MLDPAVIERISVKADGGPIVVALSGGGDSTALLQLLAEKFEPRRLRAVVVDHALRPGSAADAARAAAIAAALGVPAQIETLHWDADANRAHEAARAARYAALCAATRTHGACVIAVGHTEDDQAETVLLRAARGSGVRGLAGMRAWAPAPVWPEGRGVWLARPLLGVRRAALRALLQARRLSWIEDPANANTGYARVRARTALAALEAGGLAPARLSALAARLAAHADALDAAAYALITRTVGADAGVLRFRRADWAFETAISARALAALVTAAGAHPRGPSTEQTAALARALAAPDFSAATLAGALIRVVRGDVVLTRDQGALAGRADGAAGVAPLALEAWRETVWDGRLALTAAAPGWTVVVADGAPQLARGDERAPLQDFAPSWLTEARIRQVLGVD